MKLKINDIPLPKKGIRYTDNQGETFEAVGRGKPVGLTYWWKLKDIKTGQEFEATFSQIKQAVIATVDRVINASEKINKELDDKSRLDPRKLEEPMTD